MRWLVPNDRVTKFLLPLLSSGFARSVAEQNRKWLRDPAPTRPRHPPVLLNDPITVAKPTPVPSNSEPVWSAEIPRAVRAFFRLNPRDYLARRRWPVYPAG